MEKAEVTRARRYMFCWLCNVDCVGFVALCSVLQGVPEPVVRASQVSVVGTDASVVVNHAGEQIFQNIHMLLAIFYPAQATKRIQKAVW